MKRRIFTTVAFVCCFTICLAVVADLSGKWTGSLKTPNGDFALNYNFTLSGDKVTGTAETPQGTINITDGKVTGNDFTFNVDVNGMPVPNTCKYYPEGDTISLTLDYSGYKMHSTLKRSTK
ncbi:hypothetical protein BDD43_3937 [Mucilaginibacter gracilis]|uniref:Glycoside hydrolase n=1 Tax=Mucilaginibacter gracilis TaxID=423350 RepID=A0A495J4H1_9SPHI|nr:glycoside hydrolase [Mucilaginibacter gracilis]RKR83723.1 hypothetical protein BDD43_3937 [Mucilaginibacter gracilis]